VKNPKANVGGSGSKQARKAAARAAARSAGPAIPPVGVIGETDLVPGRANPAAAHYPSVDGSADDVDRVAVRELFSEIAAGQAAPVRSFIGALRARTATKEWLEVCRPVMAVLHESATSLGLGEAAQPMGTFKSALELAAEGDDGKDGAIEDAARDLILEAYEAMAKNFPEAFALGSSENRRDSMLLHALLKQVHNVGVVTLDAIYGAGLTSLEAVSQANPRELSATSGISIDLADAICNRLQEHVKELERTSHLPSERRFKARLEELLSVLVWEHDDFERLAAQTSVDEREERLERKRAARRSRNLCALKVEATLVEMGEIEMADRFRSLPFDQRIELVAQFLGVRVAKRPTEQQSR
jgi:hypothetical protein